MDLIKSVGVCVSLCVCGVKDLTAVGVTCPSARKRFKSEIGKLDIDDGIPRFLPASVSSFSSSHPPILPYPRQSSMYRHVKHLSAEMDIGQRMGHVAGSLLPLSTSKLFNLSTHEELC